MMKKMIVCMMAVLLMLGLWGCAGEPAETTLPTETALPAETEPVIPETTVPPATEPKTPVGYVPLNEMLEGSDIVLTVEGENVTLTEDGLTVELSADKKEVYRRGYIAGVMEQTPVLDGDLVYIHREFFDSFFCKEGTDTVSLFHGSQFFADEVIAALEQPDASTFHIKLAAEVCLPGSMGIEVPRIDPERIFSENPMSNYSDMLNQELKGYGYDGDYVFGEYAIIVQTKNRQKPSDAESIQAILDRMTDEQEAFFAEKQIQLTDYYDLNSWFQGGFMDASDEDLIDALETCYKAKLSLSLGWEYPEN